MSSIFSGFGEQNQCWMIETQRRFGKTRCMNLQVKRFRQRFCTFIPDYTASHPRRNFYHHR